MANRDFEVCRTLHNEGVLLAFHAVIDGASAVSSQSSGSLSFVTVTKPAGTGIYRCTFADTFQAVLYGDAQILVAAGTLDRDIQPVAETNAATSTPLVMDFQVRKTSDGTAVDPVSLTIKFLAFLRNSTVTP